MSRFFSEKHAKLVPYTPGEQPRERKYIKLNTNEAPFPPSPLAVKYAQEAAGKVELYSDPRCTRFIETASRYYGLDPDQIIATNGSDEILNFAFMAFCDAAHPAVFPDVTYGFYPVFADLNGVPYEQLPLKDDFSIDLNDYKGKKATIFIANPNAPTGLALHRDALEALIAEDPDRVVVVDEAYIDFGGESCVPLISRYDNLLVTQTFSKSRSMAGARLGVGLGSRALIADCNTIKYSTNPYNVNSMTLAAGVGALEDDAYRAKVCEEVRSARAWTKGELTRLGFVMPDSSANFLFAKSDAVGGMALYQALRARGILVRHFETPRLRDYNRITIGTMEQMRALIAAIEKILEEA